MGKKIISENEIAMVEAVGEIIANKIRSTIIDAHKLFSIKEPSFARVVSILIVAIVDVVKDFSDVHQVSLAEEMGSFVDLLMYTAKKANEFKSKKEEKDENKEDGKE